MAAFIEIDFWDLVSQLFKWAFEWTWAMIESIFIPFWQVWVIIGVAIVLKEILIRKHSKTSSYENMYFPPGRYLSPEVRKRVWRRDKRRCVKCRSQRNLQFDHIIPFSKGGSDTADNIQILCKSCNKEKGDKIGF